MVKTGARGPGRQRLLPPVGKGLLEAAISLPGKWITAWDHAALAGIDARKAHRAHLKLDDRAELIEQPIFPEGRDAANLYIGSQAKAQVVGINAREPGAHLSERGCTDDSRPECLEIIGKTREGVTHKSHRKTEKAA